MRVMISSTALDLPEHFAAAEDAVLRMSMEPRLMERLPPGSGNALERSIRLVDDSELYVAILVERYGTICPARESPTPTSSWSARPSGSCRCCC